MTKEQAITYLKKLSDTYHCMRSWDEVGRVEKIIDMLQNATIWTPCTERMPDLEDANEDGYVNTQRRDGTTEIEHWDDVRKSEHIIAWSRIEPIQGGGL